MPILLLILFLATPAGPAMAQTLRATTLGCDQFEKLPDGGWRAKSFIILPCGAPLSRRKSFGAGAIFCGRRLAEDLDDACQ